MRLGAYDCDIAVDDTGAGRLRVDDTGGLCTSDRLSKRVIAKAAVS